jgi:hypothetical protein
VRESEPNAVCGRERWCAGAERGGRAREVVCGGGTWWAGARGGVRGRDVVCGGERWCAGAAGGFKITHDVSRPHTGSRYRTRRPDVAHELERVCHVHTPCVRPARRGRLAYVACRLPGRSVPGWATRRPPPAPHTGSSRAAHRFPTPRTSRNSCATSAPRVPATGPCGPLTGAFGERIHRSAPLLSTAETCRLSLDQTRAGERRRGAGGNRWWVPTGDWSVTGVTDEAVVALSGPRGDVARSVSGLGVRVSGMSSPLRNRDPESFEPPCC